MQSAKLVCGRGAKGAVAVTSKVCQALVFCQLAASAKWQLRMLDKLYEAFFEGSYLLPVSKTLLVGDNKSLVCPGIHVDPATETLVTVGASEALTCAFLGLVNRGDEVILFDPQVQPRMPPWVCHG